MPPFFGPRPHQQGAIVKAGQVAATLAGRRTPAQRAYALKTATRGVPVGMAPPGPVPMPASGPIMADQDGPSAGYLGTLAPGAMGVMPRLLSRARGRLGNPLR